MAPPKANQNLHKMHFLLQASMSDSEIRASAQFHASFCLPFDYAFICFAIPPSATLAQLVEQLIRNEQVVGSNPMGGSITERLRRGQVPFHRKALFRHWSHWRIPPFPSCPRKRPHRRC